MTEDRQALIRAMREVHRRPRPVDADYGSAPDDEEPGDLRGLIE